MKFGIDVQHHKGKTPITFERSMSKFKVKIIVLKIFRSYILWSYSGVCWTCEDIRSNPRQQCEAPTAHRDALSKDIHYNNNLRYLHQVWKSGRCLTTGSNFRMKYGFWQIQHGGLAEVCTLWLLSHLFPHFLHLQFNCQNTESNSVDVTYNVSYWIKHSCNKRL